MMIRSSALRCLALSSLCALSAPALAIDCGKAGTDAEHLICSDPAVIAADVELNRVWSGLMKSTPDQTIRAALVASQKRWLVARDDALARHLEHPDDEVTPSQAALTIIRARTEELGAKAEPEKYALVRQTERQRSFLAQFSGGAYAGYMTSCDMLPPGYDSYACFTTRHYQNDDRICSVEEYFATNAIYTLRHVAEVAGKQINNIASCSFHDNDADCAAETWDTDTAVRQGLYPTAALPKLDADVRDEEDYGWLARCLTDDAFPVILPKPGKADT